MKSIFISLFMLVSIAATAQKQPVPTDTLKDTSTPAKPDVRHLGKTTTATTITETRSGRRKKRREEKANAKAVQQYNAPKDTIALKTDTIKVYKTDSIITQ